MSTWTRRCDGAAAGLVLAGLALTWLGRAGVAVGLPTTPLSFADFVLLPLGLILSVAGSGRALRPRWLSAGVAGFAGVGLVSGVVNDLPMAQIGIGVMLYLEPFIAVFVLCNSSAAWLRKRTLWVVGGVLAAQVPFVVGQWILLGAGDLVQGTLIGAGAGAHVLGSGLLMGVALLLASPRPMRPPVVLLVCASIAGMVVADAKQVWALIPVVVVVIFLKRALAARGDRSRPRISGVRIATGVVLLTALAVPVVVLVSNTYVGNILALTAENRGGKVAVTQTLVDDVTSSTPKALVGLGSGETVSRLAWMLTPAGGVEDSSLTRFGIQPSAQALTYREAALSQGYVGESSVSYPLSSLLGILGDYGVMGCLAYSVLLGGISASLWRSRDPLAAAALGVWVSLLALGLISDWLEQTPITLMVAVISGVALRHTARQADGPATDDHVVSGPDAAADWRSPS